MLERRSPFLEVSGLEGWYGDSYVLHGVDLAVKDGEVVALMGRNGAGRTTTLRAIMGLLEKRRGSVRVRGTEMIGSPAHRIARSGMAYCPEERAIFGSLTARENFLLPPRIAPGGMDVAQIYELFPNLSARGRTFGTKLSGGEQQMLAIARILRTGARALLLDEPTEGLAPVIVQEIAAALKVLKASGYTILLVEQNFRFAQTLADRFYVLEHGRVVDHIAGALGESELARLSAYLGV